MTPLRKNVSHSTVAAPTSSKGKGKVVEVAKPTSYHPTYLMSTSPTLKILSLLPPRHRVSLQLRPNPNTLISNSSRCFSVCRSRWKSNKQRWVDSARWMPLKKTQRLVPKPDSSSRSTYCENRSPPELVKKELGLFRRHNMTGNRHATCSLKYNGSKTHK